MPVMWPNTRAWRERARAELERRGRGARARCARAVGISGGALTDILKENDEPDQARASRFIQAINDHLGLPPLHNEAAPGAPIADQIREIHLPLICWVLTLTPVEIAAWELVVFRRTSAGSQ